MGLRMQDAKILVVDDEILVADLLMEALTSFGYQVMVTYSAREGLGLFKKHDFQLVITDLKMPEMDGMQLMAAIKYLDSKVVVVIITGAGTIESAVEAMKKGAYDFITKPISLEGLKLVVAKALERKTMDRQLSIFRGLTFALLASIPFWMFFGILVSLLFDVHPS